MPPKNDHRGEVTAELNGTTYTLKLTLDSIRLAEVQASASWQGLIGKALDGTLRLDDLAAVLWAALRGGNGGVEVLSYEEVVDLVLEEGLLKVNPPIRDLLFLQAIGAKREENFRTAEPESTGSA